MHADTIAIDVHRVLEAGPLAAPKRLKLYAWLGISVGAVAFILGISLYDHPEIVWGALFVNLNFFLGLSLGGIMIAAMFQIVRAKWSTPVRRFAEANVAFLPIAYSMFLVTYFGREHLFAWGRHPLPG